VADQVQARWPADAIIDCSDSLLTGPSSLDVERHIGLRAAYWKRALPPVKEIRKILARAASTWVWLQFGPAGELSLCRALYLVQLFAPGAADCYAVQRIPLSRPRERVQRIPRRTRRHASDVWRAFTSASPAAFQVACATGFALAPGLPRLSRARAALFPRQDAGRLRLSLLDEGLLHAVDARGGGASTPLQTYVRLRAMTTLSDVLESVGDLTVAGRIEELCSHRKPLLAGTRVSPAAPMLSLTDMHLTDAGAAALRDGLVRLEDAPTLSSGGATAYSTSDPWVVVGGRRGYRFRRLGS
jgi:hypothetical protein